MLLFIGNKGKRTAEQSGQGTHMPVANSFLAHLRSTGEEQLLRGHLLMSLRSPRGCRDGQYDRVEGGEMNLDEAERIVD
jgi:hypothetical protein